MDDGLFLGDCKEESFWDFRAFTDHLTRLLWATSQSLENAARPLGLLPHLFFSLSVARREVFSAWAFPPSHEYKLPFFQKSARIILIIFFQYFC